MDLLMEITLFCCALILAGALVYASNDSAGSLLMATGITLALGRWIWLTFFKGHRG
jgi:hypothetical protein